MKLIFHPNGRVFKFPNQITGLTERENEELHKIIEDLYYYDADETHTMLIHEILANNRTFQYYESFRAFMELCLEREDEVKTLDEIEMTLEDNDLRMSKKLKEVFAESTDIDFWLDQDRSKLYLPDEMVTLIKPSDFYDSPKLVDDIPFPPQWVGDKFVIQERKESYGFYRFKYHVITRQDVLETIENQERVYFRDSNDMCEGTYQSLFYNIKDEEWFTYTRYDVERTTRFGFQNNTEIVHFLLQQPQIYLKKELIQKIE